MFTLVFASCSNEVIVVYDTSKDRFERLVHKQRKNFSKFLIIDVRSSYEYRGGHIFDALNYPIDTIEKRFHELADYKELPIYIYGHNLDESFEAAKVLAENGFQYIYNCEGVDDAEYSFYLHNAVRLKTGFDLSKEKDFQLVDYRPINSQKEYSVLDANFIQFPNLHEIINSIDYAEGYVIFSTNITHARDCAREFISYGFVNVYYCIDNILDYPEYFKSKEQ